MPKIIQQPPPSKEQLERWQSQANQIFECFYEKPRTMFQVSKLTNIERPSICRRVDDFRKAGTIKVVSVDLDPLTQRRAQYFSSNPRFWPNESKGVQFTIFQ